MRTRLVFGALALVVTLWAFTQFVLAEKEANVYIFPSAMGSDGWENDEASLMQDLSPDAELVDFTRDNSSQVFFGKPVSTSTVDTSVIETPAPAPAEAPIVEVTTTPQSDAPASVTETLPSFPNPFVPSGINIETPVVAPMPTVEETAPSGIQSKIEQTLRDFLTRVWSPHSAIALEVPTTTSEIVSDAPNLSLVTDLFISSGVGSLEVPPLVEGSSASTASTSTFSEIIISDIVPTGDTATTADASPLPILPSVESADPYTVALCTTLGKTCHVMEFDGFGLGGALDKNPLLGATLEISLAGSGAFTTGAYDRVIVRAYHAGHWQFLGSTELRGEVSNGKHGGYRKYELPDIAEWQDLSDLKIVVEYDRTSDADASAYVDGIWINARYANDALADASAEDVALSGMNIRSTLLAKDAEARKARRDRLMLPEGKELSFVNRQDYAGATLSVKTDDAVYHALGDGRTYFNVTNESADPQVVRVQFHFPVEGANVKSLSRFAHNVPYKVGQLKYNDIGYFCDAGWESGTSPSTFRCAVNEEVRSCDRLNDDKTNCITVGARVGLTEGTEYRDGWMEAALRPGSIIDDAGLFAKAVDLLLNQLPPDIMPSTVLPVAHLGDSVLLQPGQTMYFRADITVPLNGRGDFFVEAAAQSGAYGLVRSGWDGSWNHRAHISIDNENITTDGTFAIPISLDNAPSGFWEHVSRDGSDIRFVDEAAAAELPYWLQAFDTEKKTGLVWVRANGKDGGASTTIAMYYDFATTTSRSDPAAPFRTTEPEPRGIIFGGSQSDMTLHVIALDDNVRVLASDKPEVVLKKGESALFDGMKPGSVISADGPIAASVEAPGANAIYVPTGYAGDEFIIPGIGGERELSLGVTAPNVTHAGLGFTNGPEILDPVRGSIVGRPIALDESVTLTGSGDIIPVLGSNSQSFPTPIYPATTEELFGFQVGRSVVGVAWDATAFTVACGNGARQEVDGRRKGMTVKLDHCGAGEGLLSDAVRVMGASNPIGIVGEVNENLTVAVPRSEFASSYLSPYDATGVSILCAGEDGAMDIGVFDPQGGILASSTCAGAGVYPGRTFIAPVKDIFAAGFSVRTISSLSPQTFLAAIVPSVKASVDAKVSHALLPLISPQLSRVSGARHPGAQIGEEEFVVPGEHRRLDVDADGRDKDHFGRLLSKDREFSIHQLPAFVFQYKRQANGLLQSVRDVFGVKPFSVSRVVLKHATMGDIPVNYDISYGNNNEWSVALKDMHGAVRPGKYTLYVEIAEGGEVYVDEYDFYWGVLAINFNKTVFTEGEKVAISVGALSNNGNTICDANVKLWITDTVGVEDEVLMTPSGLCNGNNVVDVPDYSAMYALPNATGTYKVKLVRFDQYENVASQVSDSFEVRESVPYSVERDGPTRIYPLAHYPMKIRIHANEAFEGNIVERIPGDFTVIDRGNANLEWGDAEHTFITATWPVKLSAGGSIDLQYTFDAPDRSPFLFLLGPLEMTSTSGGTNFSELRQWQIASDAAGKMILYWDGGAAPSGWTCVSCLGSDPFSFRIAMGSSTYGGQGGATTTTHTVSGTINTATSTAVAESTQNNLLLADNLHGHSVTPNVVAATNTPLSKTLRVIQSTSAGEPPSLPVGAIAMFDIASTSLPLTWYRYAPMDGYYAMASTSVGSTTGANTHAHTVTGSTSPATGNGYRSRTPTISPQPALLSHVHRFSTSTNPTVNNEPPYVEVLYARLTVATTTLQNFNGMITMWDNTPPAGWTNQSDAGQVFDGKFLKASTTYSGTGGGTTHTHIDMSGGAVQSPDAQANGRTPTSPVVVQSAPGDHSHAFNLSGYSTDTSLPNYIEVIFAKRFSGITVYAQDNHLWYDNVNANTPTDIWPPGGSTLGEGDAITVSTQPPIPGNVLRLRMTFNVTNATATALSQAFKLQYVAADSGTCASALMWTDVGAIGAGGALWRGYNNAGVTDGANLSSLLLTNSNVGESYTEQNNSSSTPTEIPLLQTGEWDWVIQDNLATEGTNYCFRMVKSDGTPLDTYTDYPEAITNSAPDLPVQTIPFDNQKVSSVTPDFRFVGVDPELNDLDYEIQIDTTATFTAPFIDKESTANPELFDNINTPANKAPFYSGDTIHFAPTTALTNGVTYWWRVRAKDTNASNTYGAWSAIQSFTIDTSVVRTTWFQTRQIQFLNDTFDGATTTGANDVQLVVGSSTGYIYSQPIYFSVRGAETVWATTSWSRDETNGTVRLQVEYYTSTSSWALIPDADLSGNAATFGGGSKSLLTLDPNTYSIIRLKATLINISGSPILQDWTVSWGYKVVTPTQYLPFDNAKVGTTTPSFEFRSSDPLGGDLYYEIQWSTTSAFTSSTTRNSQASTTAFINIQNATDTQPFNSGDRIRFTPYGGDTLSATTTYYWRVRAKDVNGTNVFSFWSSIWSITTDSALTYTTWFQTHDGQFSTDALTSMETFASNTLRVATTTGDAMFAYASGVNQAPKYRLWDGASWGSSAASLSASSTIQWVVLKASTLYGEYLMGTIGANKHAIFQVYKNGAWGNSLSLTTTVANVSRRGIAIAYQTLSGNAVVAACDGDADPRYAIWNSTSSSWSATGTINVASVNNCEWLRLVSSPISNEVIVMERDTGAAYEAQVLNGTTSTWGNATTFGGMTETGHEGMALEYERSGYQAIALSSRLNTANFGWRSWDGSIWSAALTNQSITDDFEWGNLKVPGYATDTLALCYENQVDDHYVIRWNGAAWVGNTVMTATGNTKNDNRSIDCDYDAATSTDKSNVVVAYSDTTNARYKVFQSTTTPWSWWSQGTISTIPASAAVQTARTLGGKILAVFLNKTAKSYDFSAWNGSTWSTTQTLETTSSVSASPYAEPFMLAAKNPATQGSVVSTQINFADGLSPAWRQVLWSAQKPTGTTFVVQVQYLDSGTGAWTLIPNAQIPGNDVGTTTSPISILNLNTTTYGTIRLVGSATCYFGTCPFLNDWSVEWALGIQISGIARAHDLTTNVTSGTVAVAVNGAIQTGRTGTIAANGSWYIDNVNAFAGNVVTVFISGANDFNEAVAVAKYTGPGDMGGMKLSERWLTLGSASTTGQTLTLTDIGRYDNSISANEDIFYDVGVGGDYTNCATGVCLDSSIDVYSNTFRPSTSTPQTVNTWDMRNVAYFYADANTVKVSGSWINVGGFTSNASTIIFNATSSTRTIDSTGAATSTFFNVTFGESGNVATWGLSSAFTATGTVSMNFGTTSPGTSAMTLQGDLSIGASGTFLKGTATTTFSGALSKTWTDSTASKQDLGNILIDGTAKTLTLGSSVRASAVKIGADDILNAGGANTMTVLGFWENLGTFTAQTGTVTFATTTASLSINQGISDFYNLTFNGSGGSWRWLNTNATATANVTITVGTVTLPGGTLAVGSSFDNSGGTFVNSSGAIKFTSTATGRNVRFNGSNASTLLFSGTGGGWTFLDANATATQDVFITAGTPTFPSGTLEVGRDFLNQSGAFTANGGTLKMTSTLSGRSITLFGSSLASLLIAAAGTFTITDTNATATADVMFAAGTTVFPSGTFAIGGSFTNSAVFTAGSQVAFNASSGTKLVNPGSSSFVNVSVRPSTGATTTITANATTTGTFTLVSGNFSQTTGTALAVGGAFTNQTGGAATTWTGSTLSLNSGTSFTLNTKTLGGDAYATMRLVAGTNIRMWGSSVSTYQLASFSSMYSQNNVGISGALLIAGDYARTSGTDYWDYATDFDGTALGGSSRQVNVRFTPNATTTFTTGAILSIVGTSTATTTIDRQTTGSFAISLASTTLNASYYQFRNMNSSGLSLSGSTTITSLSYGDFEVATAGGSALTIASTTVTHNSGLQIFNVRFATTTAISAFNVTEVGTPTSVSSYIRFKQHYGNLAGEGFDVDPGGNPGYIRWDDSLFVISISGTVYTTALTPMGAPTCNDVTPNVRVKVDGLGNFTAVCSSVDGTFTVPGVTFTGDTVMTVYLDTGGAAKAVWVTRSAAASLSGVKLYQNRVIVSHEDVTPLTIANMNAYDGGDDADIPFVATLGSPNTLTVNPEMEFWVWTGKTFIPGGNITLNSGGSGNNWDGAFHIDNSSTFTAQGTESHSVGGKWTADAGATFTAASSTFIFTATTSGKAITAIVPITFWNTTFNGTGGNWSVNQTVNVGNNFVVTAGTVSGASSINVTGTSASGNGVVAMTGGTFSLFYGGTFGGTSDWSFNNLTFGTGTVATTTKTASSTVTVSSVLTVASAHVFLAGSPSTWNLTGGGTPFVQSGTFDAQTSIFRYSSNAATNITPATYHRLYLAPSASGGPTYTFSSGTFTVNNNLSIGDGVNTATVTATTNDPILNVLGDMFIRATTTFIASDSAALNASRDFVNAGLFTSSGGTVNFIATTTGRFVTTASSSFANVNFNGAAGGWTITGNATSTSNFSLTASSQFTMASGTTLEVKGVFTNAVGGTATTWTGTTLYMNSGATSALNAKSVLGDQYETLNVAASTAISMWNSAATSTSINASGSLYSQNHASTTGLLYIFGAYARSSGTDYWSYANNFDGTALGVASRRVDVRFASATTMTVSGTGGLEVIGISTASTTLDVQSLGTYAMSFSGGSSTMRYLNVRGVNGNGFNYSGTTLANDLSDADFLLQVDGGSMITVAGGTIDVNPLKIFSRNYFSTTTGIVSGYNVKATGVSGSIWRFSGTPALYGNYSGEARDSDPGGDPGYIVWDDSANNVTISGNVYGDEGVTPIGGPTCNGVTQNVRLKVQGAGTYTSACNAVSGAFSISSVVFNPGDTLTLYLDTNSTTSAANISVDPTTNISNMHLYRDRVILRHEQGSPMTIAAIDLYDGNQDTDIAVQASLGAPNILIVRAGTKIIVWTAKTFTPGGNVTIHGNAASGIDGTVELQATSTWASTGSETHTLAGQFLAQSAATVVPASSTFIFYATTTGKYIAASSSLTFYNLTFSGASGGWDIGGVGTSSNDVTISAGSVMLPSGTMAIGGTFDANGGTFNNNNGTLRFTSTSVGKNIRAAGPSFSALEFRGAGGGWTFQDTNATATAGVVIVAGTSILPTGILAVGADFDNRSGTFTASGGTIKLTATSTGRIIRANGSSFAGIAIPNNGWFTFMDQNATATGDVYFPAGSTTLPVANFVIGGSFTATSTLFFGTSTVTFNPSSGTKSHVFGTSTLYNVNVLGANNATTSITTHATSTNNLTVTSGNFVQASASSFAVGGTFANFLGGGATTWTGSTLSLYSGTNYDMNTKTSGGDVYGTLRLAAGNNIRSWNSSASTYQVPANASLYSQNHGAVSGSLNIYGTYIRTSGTDYWSYATNFDGVALGGSSRQVNVRFDASATAEFKTNSSLQMVGISTASTTVDRISSGNYGLSVNSATINASYYQFRNLDITGLHLLGTTTITGLSNGDFELALAGGSMLTISSSTIDQNASAQYTLVRFATTTAIGGANVSRIGTTTNAITWTYESGNMASEAFDNDGNDACGSIRWSDSSCLISDQKTYRWRNDNGAEGALATEWFDQSWSKRQRVRITNYSTSTVTNAQVKMNLPYDADMQNNFNDLRFTDASGTTSIPFWIETYVTSGSSTVWVKVPTLTASAITDVFVYYGNGSAPSTSSGTSTFKFFDDFEDNNITEYTGDTTLFGNSGTYNYERTYGLAASAGNTGSQNTSGIWQSSSSVPRDTTFRFFQYINMAAGSGDEPCFMFAIQSPITAHQNYGICLSPFGQDKVIISKNVAYNGRSGGATELATTSVTYSTGWYEASVDWLSAGNRINVTVYNSSGAVFATTSVADSTWTSAGGVGFTFWGMNGGWDIPTAREYISSTPSIEFGLEQGDSGATWKAAENTVLVNQLPGENIRLRMTVKNSGLPLTNKQFRLQVAAKLASPNCESVPTGNYTDITANGSCGTSPACMAASSQFADKASTTQLLSIPLLHTFVNGQIMEDTSVQTSLMALPALSFTEVEYNFQMVIAYAVQNAYCFRVTDAGTPLDNYSKVAEMTVLHGPVIANLSFNGDSSIALTEGTSTVISATATVSDLNGYADIVAASSTFYRSSVAGGRSCTADSNDCYQIGTSSCSLYNCSGNSCDVSCSAPMKYFADPTDPGSYFNADMWQAIISAWDTSYSYDMSSSSEEVLTLAGMNASSTISYGSIIVGDDTGATDATTTVNNTGNVVLNLGIGGDPMVSGASSISYDKQKYSTSTFTYSTCGLICNILTASTSPTYFPVAITKPTSTAAFFRDIYWGLAVPLGTAATTHSGVNYFFAQ